MNNKIIAAIGHRAHGAGLDSRLRRMSLRGSSPKRARLRHARPRADPHHLDRRPRRCLSTSARSNSSARRAARIRAPTATYSYRAMGLALDIHVSDLGAGGIADGIDVRELARRFDGHEEGAGRRDRGARPEAARRPRCRSPRRRCALGARSDLSLQAATARAARRICGSRPLHGLVIDARFDVALGFEEDGDIGRGEILATLGDAIPASADAVAQARVRAHEPHDVVGEASDFVGSGNAGRGKQDMARLPVRRGSVCRERDGWRPCRRRTRSSFEEEVRGRQIALATFRALKRDSAPPEISVFQRH